MRYKAGQKEQTRARLTAAVGRGFRKRGYNGIGVDGLAKEAEVTSGAFYGYFPSKEAAFKEAVTVGIDDLRSGVERLQAEHGAGWLEVFIDFYLGHRRTCELGETCALQSLTPEVVRADVQIKTAFEGHLRAAVEAVAAGLGHLSGAQRLDRAWSLLALLSGAVTMARAVGDEATSREIASAAKQAALTLCGRTTE